MPTSLTRFTVLAFGLLASIPAAAQTLLLHAGELLAVPGEAVLTEHTVVVTDGRISEIRPGYATADAFEGEVSIIDLRDAFVLPGLMDMHVHLQSEMGPNRAENQLKMSPQLMQMQSIVHARRTLEAGFTTVRDVGSSGEEMYALRDAIERGWITGPRIIAAGGVGITGGHADVSGMKPELMEFYTDASICDGPFDCRRATRNAIKYGADWIKITSTGGVMTDRATGTGQQMEMDELTEVVRAATRMGRKVASHAHHESGIIAALEAGVASVEHGSYTGPRAIELFLETGAYLVPTLLAGKTVRDAALNSDYLSEAIREKAIRVGTDMQGNFEAAHRAGVKIAFGTDSGVSKHGENAQEAVLMVEAGMAPMDVIRSATVNTADLLDMSAEIGTIETGKAADIIAVSGSPLDNISELLDVDFVMKGGQLIRQ